MKSIAVSLLIVLAISTGIGFFFQEMLDSFWRGFIGALICHFFFVMFTTSAKNKDNRSDELEQVLDTLLELQTTSITCPCGKQTFTEPVFVNKENVFYCDKCSSNFRVDVNLDTVLQTKTPDLHNIYNSLQNKEHSYNSDNEDN
tara:strand:- start:130 stop:561 length:432 start_codon:yes stop_codon:yes gene_type:complete